MIDIEDICDPEQAEWYRMTPAERWAESEKLWAVYLSLGGSPRAYSGRRSVGPRPSESPPDKEDRRCLMERSNKARRSDAGWRACSRPKPGGPTGICS